MTILVHIAGASGSGKTTLGNRIKKAFPFLVVKDLDDLYDDLPSMFPKEYQQKEYQQFEDKTLFYEKFLKVGYERFVQMHDASLLVFVGFNGTKGYKSTEDDYIRIDARYKFFIDIPEEQILRQRFNRYIDYLSSHREEYFNRLLKQPLQIDFEVWLSKINASNKDYYRKHDYNFCDSVTIFEKIKNKMHQKK